MITYGVIGAIIGSGTGFIIGSLFKKLGGYCPLLCNPKISTIYFAVMGFIIGYK